MTLFNKVLSVLASLVMALVCGIAAFGFGIYEIARMLGAKYQGGDSIMFVIGMFISVPVVVVLALILTIWLYIVFSSKFKDV